MLLQFQKEGEKIADKKTFYSACFTAAAVAVAKSTQRRNLYPSACQRAGEHSVNVALL